MRFGKAGPFPRRQLGDGPVALVPHTLTKGRFPVRFLVQWLFGRRPVGRQRSDGVPYRSNFCLPLIPAQVRARRFRRTRLGRRGLDPVEVRAFLDRVALDLAYAQEAAERARQETHRIKEALRRWQSEQARIRDPLRSGNQHPTRYRPPTGRRTNSVPGPALLPYR